MILWKRFTAVLFAWAVTGGFVGPVWAEGDLTELSGRWYVQSYWQDPKIRQVYAFAPNEEDRRAGASSVQVRMKVAAERPGDLIELRFEPVKPVDLSAVEALEVSLKFSGAPGLKPRDVFLCSPGFRKLSVIPWPRQLDLGQTGQWQRVVLDLTEARVLDKDRPGKPGSYDRRDVATVCFNFNIPAGELDATLLIDKVQPIRLPPPPVVRTRLPDGAYQFKSVSYEAVIGTNGYLRSLRAGKTSFLKAEPFAATDQTNGSGMFPDNDPAKGLIKLDSLEPAGRAGLNATGEQGAIRYVFREHEFDIVVQQTFTRAGRLCFALSPDVVATLDGRTDRALFAKTRDAGNQIDSRLVTRSGGVLIGKQYVDGYSRMSMADVGGDWSWCFLSFGSGANKLTLQPVGSPSASKAIGFTIEGPNPDFLNPGGRPVQFRLNGRNYAGETVAGNFRFEVCDYLTRKPLKERVTPFRLAAGDKMEVPCDVNVEKPGTYRGRLTVADDHEERSVEWVFVHDFPNYSAPVTRPADFHEFWCQTLEELRAIPMDAKITAVPEVSTKDAEAFKVSLATLGGRRVHCWYWKPRAAGKYPAVFELPSSGVYPRLADHVPRGPDRCGMWMAIHGLPVDYERGKYPDDPAALNYWTHGIESPQTSMWRTIYASLVRGVDFLRSRPEVDAKRIMVSGGSQGGGLTMVLAGLDHRIAFAAPAHSGLARLDWTVLHTPGFWPFSMKAKPVGQTTAQFLKTLSYFDAANFTPDIACPVVAEVSLLDTVTASGNQICALSHLKPGLLELICDPWDSHASSPRGAALRGAAINRWLKGENPISRPIK